MTRATPSASSSPPRRCCAAASRPATNLMESGAGIDEALRRVPLPRFATSRAAAIAGAEPSQAASRLEVLAAECGARFRTHTDRWLALVQPVALVLIGIGLAGMFHAVMQVHDHYLAEAMPLW